MTKLFEAMEAALGQERTSYEWTLAFTLAQIPVVLFVLASTGGFVLVRKLPQWLWRCCRCLCFRKNQEGDSKLKELQNQYRMQIAKSAAALGLLLSAAYRLYQLANGTQDELRLLPVNVDSGQYCFARHDRTSKPRHCDVDDLASAMRHPATD